MTHLPTIRRPPTSPAPRCAHEGKAPLDMWAEATRRDPADHQDPAERRDRSQRDVEQLTANRIAGCICPAPGGKVEDSFAHRLGPHVHDRIGAERPDDRELGIVRAGPDHPCAERLAEIMAERGGDVLLGAHPPADAARQLPLDRQPASRDQPIPRSAQRRTKAPRLNCLRYFDPRQTQEIVCNVRMSQSTS